MADWPYNHAAWATARTECLERDEYRCRINGPKCKGHATEADHIIPLAEGGAPFDQHNLRAACQPCNGGRTTARTAAAARLNRQSVTQPSRDWFD